MSTRHGDGEAGVREVEAGEAVGAVAEHADVERLEPLERRADVEDRLHARADDRHAGPRERGQVGRLVPALARLAVDAAEPAGGEDADAGAGGEVGGRGDGRRRRAAGGDHRGEVAQPRLREPGTERQRLERVVVEPDPDLAGDDGDRGRDGALGAHHGLELAGHLEVPAARQPVGDQGALERHDGLAGGERAGDLRGDPRRGWTSARPSYAPNHPSSRALSDREVPTRLNGVAVAAS